MYKYYYLMSTKIMQIVNYRLGIKVKADCRWQTGCTRIMQTKTIYRLRLHLNTHSRAKYSLLTKLFGKKTSLHGGIRETYDC